MPTLLQRLETAAARGAAGLDTGARGGVAAALRALWAGDGGFAGLDGRSDPYYTLFAWLALRALGAEYDRGWLRACMDAHRNDANPVDVRCARLLLSVEGRKPRLPRLRLAAEILRGDLYGAFLSALDAATPPRWLARLAWHRLQRAFPPSAAERLPTPRLAAGLVLASLAGADGSGFRRALETRRFPGGGYVSAPGAPPDLLATAAARFVLTAFSHTAQSVTFAEDLRFVEACWLEDGLFGASPGAARGDAEHTFYALLALGTCR
jgi:hypothetical protein